LAHDVVVEYSPQTGGFSDTHERITRAMIAITTMDRSVA
jgi:hypothetical protein